MGDLVQFDRESAKRISDVVRQAEARPVFNPAVGNFSDVPPQPVEAWLTPLLLYPSSDTTGKAPTNGLWLGQIYIHGVSDTPAWNLAGNDSVWLNSVSSINSVNGNFGINIGSVVNVALIPGIWYRGWCSGSVNSHTPGTDPNGNTTLGSSTLCFDVIPTNPRLIGLKWINSGSFGNFLADSFCSDTFMDPVLGQQNQVSWGYYKGINPGGIYVDSGGGFPGPLPINGGSNYYPEWQLLFDGVWFNPLNNLPIPTDWPFEAIPTNQFFGTDSAGIVRSSTDAAHPILPGSASPIFDCYPPSPGWEAAAASTINTMGYSLYPGWVNAVGNVDFPEGLLEKAWLQIIPAVIPVLGGPGGEMPYVAQPTDQFLTDTFGMGQFGLFDGSDTIPHYGRIWRVYAQGPNWLVSSLDPATGTGTLTSPFGTPACGRVSYSPLNSDSIDPSKTYPCIVTNGESATPTVTLINFKA